MADHYACIWEGKKSGAKAERPAGGGDPGRDLRLGPGPRRPSTVTSNEDGVVSDGVAVHSKWDGTGCEGMARCPIPVVWPKFHRPLSLL